MLENVIAVSNGNVNMLCGMLSDVPEEKLCHQPPGIANHPIWQAGHLALVRTHLAREVGKSASIDEAWIPLFGRGSSPSVDASKYPSRAEVLNALRTTQAALVEGVRTTDPAKFDRPHGIQLLANIFPTLGALVTGSIFHDGLHIGQLSAWRRMMNLPRMIG